MPIKVTDLPDPPGALTGDEYVPVVYDPTGSPVTVKVPISSVGGGGGGSIISDTAGSYSAVAETQAADDGIDGHQSSVSLSTSGPYGPSSGGSQVTVFTEDVAGTGLTLVRLDVGGFTVFTAQADGTQASADDIPFAFMGATPATRPVIPATPNAQDIADVLVALGLATQAP